MKPIHSLPHGDIYASDYHLLFVPHPPKELEEFSFESVTFPDAKEDCTADCPCLNDTTTAPNPIWLQPDTYPEPNEPFLAITKNPHVPFQILQFTAPHHLLLSQRGATTTFTWGDIKAWMPLPSPP